MKKILLLVPQGKGPGNNRKWNRDWTIQMEDKVSKNLWKTASLGPLVLGAIAAEKGYEVHFAEEEYMEVQTSVYYDIAAIYTVTPNAKRAYEWCRYFRKMGTYTILGGVHAAVCSSEASEYADTLLLGEAEEILIEFLDDYAAGKAKKSYIQPIGMIKMADSPIPAYSLLPPMLRRIMPLQTARGCPHGCKFCNLRSLYGNGYRPKEIPQVEKELLEILRLNPKAVVYFTDDNFFSMSTRALELMRLLRMYKINWYANMDISFGKNEEIIKLASKSGCRQVLIGLESIEEENLKEIDDSNFKYGQMHNYKSLIHNIQSQGIGVIGSFIVGLENDTTDTFRKTEEFIIENHLYGANITVNTPYPGTIFFNTMKKEGRILSYDWDQYTIFQPVIKPKKLSVEQLNEGYKNLLEAVNSQEAVNRKIDYFKMHINKKEGRRQDA